MPSVGSTPTSSPSNQQQSQQQQQAPQQQQQSTQKQQPQPPTVQASISQSPHTVATSIGDASPSPSTSFSSVDTNQTLLNGFSNGLATSSSVTKNRSSSVSNGTNRSYRTKYSQFMIITPAVSIDRNFDNETGAPADNDVDESCYYNGNYFRMNLINSNNDSSGNDSSDSSFRSNYNSTLHNSRHHLLSNNPHGFYTFSSWRWCTLICAAMRCFGGGRSSNVPYSTSFSRRPYNGNERSSRQRQSSFNHHLPTFTPRKTRDHMNNITYEL
ncbi:uncharacterized protein DDB_G0283357-like [Eupeodes corollae]|uniref:uncharacterized protein DDB_G0283357-like n=1 Tax=Eupeodes corollae TaxID=290404 RepID=UPI002493C226|nr:uncharacterized protein DDB_G0283357-like [Eupeodes corollae]